MQSALGMRPNAGSSKSDAKLLIPLVLLSQTQPVISGLTYAEQGVLQQLGEASQRVSDLLAQGLTGTAGACPETVPERLAMYLRISQAISPQHQAKLGKVLASGKLTQTGGDDAYSTLFHLYALVTTPRAEGLNPIGILQNTIDILAEPEDPKQDYTPLNALRKRQMMEALQKPEGSAHQLEAPVRIPGEDELQIIDSNNCAAASEQSRLASQRPKEFARMVNQLTSPMMTLVEKASAEQISPEDPTIAEETLKQSNQFYHKLPNGEFLIQLPAPKLGLIRALAAQDNPHPKLANPVEVLFQTTMLYNFTNKSFDASTDARDTLDMAAVSINQAESLNEEEKGNLIGILQEAKTWGEGRRKLFTALKQLPSISPIDMINITQGMMQESYGLTEMEKNLMERIMEDGEPMTSVLYQIEGGPSQPTPYNQGEVYVYGYSRTFDEMTQDLLNALKNRHQVILGLAETAGEGEADASGSPLPPGLSLGGHEVKVIGFDYDKQSGALYFKVTDSDDSYYDPEKQALVNHKQDVDPENPVVRKIFAKDLIPKVHHMGLPHGQAKAIWDQLKANPNVFNVPDSSDATRYNVISVNTSPPPESVFLPGQQAILNEQALQMQRQLLAQQQAQQLNDTTQSMDEQGKPHTKFTTAADVAQFVVPEPPSIPDAASSAAMQGNRRSLNLTA